MIPASKAPTLVVILALALMSCNNEPQTDVSDALDSIAKMNANWEELPDGSHFARTSFSTDTTEHRAAVRCWPRSTGKFECLEAIASSALSTIHVGIRLEQELPATILPVPSQKDGYNCEFLLTRRENIIRGGDRLLSNEVNIKGKWSRDFVTKYMKENNISGINYFRCLDILNYIIEGSLETVSTTSITYSLIE